MERSIPTRELVVELREAPVGDAERRQLLDALDAAVAGVWQELGLVSSPAISLGSRSHGRLCEVWSDGHRLPLSGRRRHQVAVAVTGRLREPSEPSGADAFVDARFAEAEPWQRNALVVALVEAAALASTGMLMAMEARELAQAWSDSGGLGSLDDVERIVQLAGSMGLAPSHVEPAALERFLNESDDDPHGLCDALVIAAQATTRLDPVIEMARPTLRRLTTSTRPLRPELLGRAGPHAGVPRSIRAFAYTNYGVALPDVGLAVSDDIPPDRFRVRFGGVHTPTQLVLAEGWTAVESVAEFELSATPVAAYLDPVYGDWWPVIETGEERPETWDARMYEPAALVVRGLYAELETRLAWWAPRSIPEVEWLVRGDLYAGISERLPAVLRGLVAGGATVHHGAPVLEGMTEALAEGDSSVAGMVRRARERLRAAALGPMAIDTEVTVVELDESSIREAVTARSPEPLLETHPELTAATGAVAAMCGTDARPHVAELLHGLRDVVRVVSTDEMAGTAIATASNTSNG
jgi:hypothetical protein